MNFAINSKETNILKSKSQLISNNIVPDAFISDSEEVFEWIWLPLANVKQLLKVRNAEHVVKNMRNSLPIDEAEHLNFLKKYYSLHRVDFVLKHKKTSDYVGGMNIALTNYGFEMGKYIGNRNFLGKGLSFSMAQSFLYFIKVNFKEIQRIHSVTKICNYKNINLNYKLGFEITQKVENDFWLMELK